MKAVLSAEAEPMLTRNSALILRLRSSPQGANTNVATSATSAVCHSPSNGPVKSCLIRAVGEVPAGQPDPLMVLMSRVILPEGGEESDGVAGAVTMARARPATANIPSIVLLQMGHSMFRRARQGS